MSKSILIIGILSCLAVFSSISAIPMIREFDNAIDIEFDHILEVVNELGNSIVRASQMQRMRNNADNDRDMNKRGIDLGLGRSFSGSKTAKQMMGLAAANFAGGPGRRRRSLIVPDTLAKQDLNTKRSLTKENTDQLKIFS